MFDALTVAALADQMTAEIEDGRVQAVGLITRQSFWIEVYANGRRHYLVASADMPAPSVYLTQSEPISDRQLITPFLLLLRKYVRGSRLVGIQQPPLERVISLTFARRLVPKEITDDSNPGVEHDHEDDDGEEDAVFTQIHLEIMGRHSNLIMVDDDGLIMEAVKRVTPRMSRVRPIAPRRPYVPPPPSGKADPRRATEGDLLPFIGTNDDQAGRVKALSRTFAGVSPQIAREAIVRVEDGSAASLARALRNLFEPLLLGTWDPALYCDDDGLPVAYAPIRLTSMAGATEVPVRSISDAIEQTEGLTSISATSGKHTVRSQRLVTAIQDALARLDGRARSLEEQELRHEDREQYRIWGEMIFGYMWQIAPGDRDLVVGDMRIPLDPAMTPSEQARQYMDRYADAKNSDSRIADARVEVERRRAYLEQLVTLAGQARSVQDIEELEAEWYAVQPETQRGRPPRRSTGKKRTVPVLTVRDQAIYLGNSGAENDRVTFDVAGPDDTWLHARGVPGSHVIVKWTPGVRDLEDVLQRAAELAAYHSQSRESGRVEVDITERRNVRKIKGAGPGMVTYRNERTVSVQPKGI
jgi:predicted ribosome quality control (RQC) complex YloA/Tae2 family protein